jgi:hypothetical protein
MDIEAYINGTPVSASKEAQFIEFSKLYWPEVSASCDEIINMEYEETDDEFTTEEEVRLLKYLAGIIGSDAKKKAAYDDEDWRLEYYRLIIVKDQYYAMNKQFQDSIENGVEQNVEEILDTGVYSYLNGDIDITGILETMSYQNNMTIEEYAEQVLKPFLELMGAEEFYRMYYAKNIYGGKVVELNETNIEEYATYYADMYEQYYAYTEELLEKAVIAERPQK